MCNHTKRFPFKSLYNVAGTSRKQTTNTSGTQTRPSLGVTVF